MSPALASVPFLLGIGALFVGRVRTKPQKSVRPLLLDVEPTKPTVIDRVDQGTSELKVGGAASDTQALSAISTEDELSAVVSEPQPYGVAEHGDGRRNDHAGVQEVLELTATTPENGDGTSAEEAPNGQATLPVAEAGQVAVGSPPVVRVVPFSVSVAPEADVAPVLRGEGARISPMPARLVVRVRRGDGTPIETPVELTSDGMLHVPETEMLPDAEQWGGVHQERMDAYDLAKAAADKKDAEDRAEAQRREDAARAQALIDIERQKAAESRWWVQLDAEAESEGARAALASSLSTVKMPWAQKVLQRAMREDASIKVRARAVGAYVRAGFLEDPAPFDEIFEEDNQVLSMAVREALAPHQDVPWIRNLFA